MEKVNNVKLDWNLILLSQKRLFQDKFRDMNADEVYAPVIDMLNNNRIPSRVIVSNGRICSYGYVMPPQGIDDRLICSMGFVNKDESYIKKGIDILSWFSEMASKESKLLIIDGIFNGEEFFSELEKLNFTRAYRVKLIGNLDTIMERMKKSYESLRERNENFIELQNDEISMKELGIAQSEAYNGTPDEFLLIQKDGHNITPEIINSGYYGKILFTPSRILHNGEIIGSVQVSDGSFEFFRINTPLLVDLFISKKYQGKGYGSYLLYQSCKKLKNLGYSNIQLWVNRDSTSYKFYKDSGFQDEGEDDLMYYRDFRGVVTN